MLPISEIIKRDIKTNVTNRADYKKAKELEEARKSGTAPAAVDEDGKDINPHIPQYISNVPFFYNTDQPSLRHQRVLTKKIRTVPLDTGIQKGLRIQNATKYRKGACENCGAITHARKDCLEKPRKIGARFTNKDIAPDEVLVPDVEHTFESKRDRWADVNPELCSKSIIEYQKVEEAKRKLREEKLKQEARQTTSSISSKQQTTKDDFDSDESEDVGEKYAEDASMPGTKVDSKHRITIRNLRIREDKAKYLYNLDLKSAYYDPKTRAMREDPLPHLKSGETSFISENFVRQTGEVNKVNQALLFALQASDKGIDVHLQALPTKTELLQKEFEKKKTEYNEKIQKFIEHKYG